MDKEQVELEVEQLLRDEYGVDTPEKENHTSVFSNERIEKQEYTHQSTSSVFNDVSYRGPKVQLYEPLCYEDAKIMATALFNQQVIFIKLTQLHEQQANRIIDFLTGVVYGIDGDIQRVSDELYICTPQGQEITEELLMRFN